ncbi:MAG TPA: hypothetical protein VIH90_04650 [Candidatus Saccharimonadales bacterium]
MKISRKVIATIVVSVLLGLLLVGSTSLVARHGNQLVPRLDSSETTNGGYRDVRGIPFVFLKRSIGDGQCDAHDLQLKLCDPGTGNEPHQVMPGWLILDAAFWVLVVFVLSYFIVNGQKTKKI